MAIADPIRHPAEMRVPTDLNEVLGVLSIEERELYLHELNEALVVGERQDDLLQAQRVVERWYRAALLRKHPGWQRAVEQVEALRRGETPADIHELDFDQLRGEVERRRRARSA